MSITECSVHRQGQFHYCVSELQVPTSYHGNWLQTPPFHLQKSWSMMSHLTQVTPQAPLRAIGSSKGMHTEQRSLLEATAQRNFTEQLIADLRLDFFFLSQEESFAFLLQGKSKMSFGHSSQNFKSHYILAITAT